MKRKFAYGFLLGIATIILSLMLMGGFPSTTADGDQFVAADLTVHGTMSYTQVAYDFIPIEWCHDGAVPPFAAAEVADGNGAVQARGFGAAAGDTVEDVVCPWEIPDDIIEASGIKFKVSLIVTNGTGPSAQGLSFKVSGYSIGDNDPLDAAFGSEAESNKTGITAVQYDRLETSYSSVVTVTALAAGELAMLHFERDTADADDTYAKPMSVTGIIIKYERSIGSVTF